MSTPEKQPSYFLLGVLEHNTSGTPPNIAAGTYLVEDGDGNEYTLRIHSREYHDRSLLRGEENAGDKEPIFIIPGEFFDPSPTVRAVLRSPAFLLTQFLVAQEGLIEPVTT